MKRFLASLVCVYFLGIPSYTNAMTPAEIMSPDFGLNKRTLEVYILLQTLAVQQESPLVACSEMLKDFLPNVQNETLLPKTRIQFSKDMLTYSLAGLFIVNMDYKNNSEQTKYGREFYNYFILSCAYLGAITSKNQDAQEEVLRKEIMYPVVDYLSKHRKKNKREYSYKKGEEIQGRIELEIFPEMNNLVLLQFNDTVVYNADTGGIRTRDWSGICIIKDNILTCKNNKKDSEIFSFQAKIDTKSIIIIKDNGFSKYVCDGDQYLRNKYDRVK